MIIIYLPKVDLKVELRRFATTNHKILGRDYHRFLLVGRNLATLNVNCWLEEHQKQLARATCRLPGGQARGAEVAAATLYHHCSPQSLARAHNQRDAEAMRRHPAGR